MSGFSNSWWIKRRIWIFTFICMVLLLVIEMRLFSMQVINCPDFLKKADANRIRADIIESTRGGIFDRQGRLLVENRPAYTLYAYPWIIRKNPETIDQLEELIHLDETQLKNRINRYGWYTFKPATILRDVDFNLLACLETVKSDLPGIEFGFAPKRSYPLPEAVHLLGYVGERSENSNDFNQSRFGLVGRHGLELVYEKYLGGEPGVRYVQVDSRGRQIGVLDDPAEVKPKRGWDLHLNIDGDLQRYAFELMNGRDGAVVAIDPRDGAVLVMLSLPDYDPTLFAGVLSRDEWESLMNDPGHPLLNRVVQGQYPPGSTYKMVVLAAGIENGIVNDGFEINCTGGMQLGNRFFRCWAEGGHGLVKWKTALQRSCDVFFYTVGQELDADKMAEYASIFGFGSATGIDFNVENSGIAPGTKYLDRKYGAGKWTAGQLMNISIGQGDVLVTPLQLACYAGAIATGRLVEPHIANRLVNRESGEEIHIEPKCKQLTIQKQTLKMLREGMRMVVNEPHGTAYPQRSAEVVIAGKTGTAQNPHGEDHGLFVAFAPFENPIIAIAVVVEHGGHGSSSAAPVACDLIDRFMYSVNPGPRKKPFVSRTSLQVVDSLAID